MAWWQKKLLKYALSRTGLLDDSTIDLDNLDVTFGKQNVFQFKDVELNIKRISKLAQLPSSLRIETARVLSLRLTVPADIYQSSIVADVDGVELSLRLEEHNDVPPKSRKGRPRSPVTTRSPQHRKVHQRLHSPPPYDPGGLGSSDEHLPTTEEMAKSFLLEESVRERRELEATVAAQSKGMEESVASESSSGESTEYGMGAAVGVPGFLAGFLQGIVDRFQVIVKNIEASVATEVPGDDGQKIPVTLNLHVGDVGLGSTPLADAADASEGSTHQSAHRRIQLNDIYINLLSDADIFAELSDLPSRSSPSTSRQQTTSDLRDSTQTEMNVSAARSLASSSIIDHTPSNAEVQMPPSSDVMEASVVTADSDRFADAGDEYSASTTRKYDTELDIQPGDDNISWGSRRNKSSAPPQDLWNSVASEDVLPDSLILQQAPTPRPLPMPWGSAAASRSHHSTSPDPRLQNSPQSWPEMEERNEHIDTRSDPVSLSNLDQSRYEVFESIDAKATAPVVDAASRGTETPVERKDLETETEEYPSPVRQPEDLAASRVFTHEEAESMFMSAMSHRPMRVPGGWGSDTASQPPSPSAERKPLSPSQAPNVPDNDPDEGLAYGELPPEDLRVRSGQATPRASSPVLDKQSRISLKPTKPRSQKRLLYIDYLSMRLPTNSRNEEDSHLEFEPAPRSTSDSFTPAGIPGTFSAYSEASASRLRPRSLVAENASSIGSMLEASRSQPRKPIQQASRTIDIELGQMVCQFDMSSSRILYRTALQAASILQSDNAEAARRPATDSPPSRDQGHVSIAILSADFDFVESIAIDAQGNKMPSGRLLSLSMTKINCTTLSGDVDVGFHTLELLLGESPLLRFDRTREMRSSITLSDTTPAVGLKVVTKMTARRAVREISVETMPIDLVLDLAAFDETFSSFGGLSGILDAGNSMLSDSGAGSSPSSPKIKKGVRFEGGAVSSNEGIELKLNGRIGGVAAILQGESCSVQLRTTTLRTLYREHGAAVTSDHAVLSGPYSPSEHSPADAPFAIDLSNARIDYAMKPEEKDLDRLLSLLTPSKDKYDGEDDILVDTLLRQRKNGAVARVTLADVKVNAASWQDVGMLENLSKELSKLSVVTRYLPEDERPGLLTLIRAKSVEARLPVSERFGKAHVNLTDLQCAHVGLPALFALSIEEMSASANGKVELVHPLLPAEHLPMVMIRTLGDEMEPLVKVKLYNVCAEYSVPVILAATGVDVRADPEEMMAEVAKSMAELLSQTKPIPQHHSTSVGGQKRAQKKTNIELLIHESAVGLQPEKLSSKAMFVLTDALFTTAIPPEDTISVHAQLRKAAMFVADEVQPDNKGEAMPSRGAPSNTATSAKLTAVLSQQGYVSVASIMSADISVKIAEAHDGTGKTIDVDARNELLLLETCADSTQTLIATLSGLAPPTPPSEQPKYLTAPMTIEDMMASFSGEPQIKDEQPPETLFDADVDDEEEPEALLDMAGFDEHDDGLLAESEMEASLYGPVSGMLEGVDNPEDDDEQSRGFTETAESLLEDDPFEMPDTPADARMSDAALVRELGKQCTASVSDRPLNLGLYEIEDLGFDALGTGGQKPLGDPHRFNVPAARKPSYRARHVAELPFRLRLRDFHIIWNVYDGYDWRRTREGITQAVEQVEQIAEDRKAKRRQSHADREEDESVIGDFLFNSIYIGVPSSRDAQDLRRQINRNIDDLASETESVPVSGMSRPTTAYSASGRPLGQRPRRRLKLERSRSHKVAFELKGVSADVLMFPPDDPDTVGLIDVRVRDFEIFDNVPMSTWRKFLTHLESDPAAREMSKPMMHVEMRNVKTLEQYTASEIVMHVTVQPIRLHVDQDALDFITRFFEFKDRSMEGSGPEGEPPFLQRVEVDTVDMCLDYKPKRVDYGGLRSGRYTEFKNFVILDGANIKLKHAIIYGIKGFEPLHDTLNNVWMPDIKRTQLPTVLAGLAPVRSLVNIGSGVRDVVAIPVREYKKDGRVVRSIQKGAMHFGKTTTSELARLGAKVAMGTQTYLTAAETMLSPTSASPRPGSGPRASSEQGWHETTSSDDEASQKPVISAYANQPLGVFSGLKSARRQLELDLLTAKDALIAVQGEMMESATPGSAAAAVARHAPTVILRPVIGASRAVGTALLGVGNQIDRGNLRKVEDKYKRR